VLSRVVSSRSSTLALAAIVALGLVTACAEDGPNTATTLDLPPDAAAGQAAYLEAGCGTCHGANGEGATHSALTGLWGTTIELTDGRSVTFDEAYVERSIREPNAETRVGSIPGVMLPYGESAISAEEMASIIAFIRAIG
jgi:cytochrome c oxidase subunit 2